MNQVATKKYMWSKAISSLTELKFRLRPIIQAPRASLCDHDHS